MNNFALLTLLRGQSNSMGKVPETRFNYPPQTKREQELFIKAVEVIKIYSFQTSFYWALVDEKNFQRFNESLQTLIPNSEIVTIPTLVMHGQINFNICLRLNDFQPSNKEKILDIIMETGIQPHQGALEFTFRRKKEAAEAFHQTLSTEEIQREARATFSRNLAFYNVDIP